MKVVIYILICQTAGIIGSFFTRGSIESWYRFLQKPAFAPPNWLFGPAWVTLYTLMGISAYLIRKNKEALTFFWVHLGINAIWSILFFGLRQPGWAMLDILIMWLMIGIMIVKFWKIDKRASWLLVPYWLWVSFASALNYSIWKLN